jgi:hypothetical protein
MTDALDFALLFVLAWAVVAYLFAPRLWKVYFRYRPFVAEVARVTRIADSHPGDPINIALVGSDTEIVRAMTAAGWYPADPITFRTSMRIIAASVLRRPDDDAPVSDLFLFDRKQDLAFEQAVGGGPRQRHHVRFWRWDQMYAGRIAWIGAATFDVRVGLSYTTGQVTHHIGPDVDAERDLIVTGLLQAGLVESIEWTDGFHSRSEGRNGGGDRWRTDGRLAIVTMRGSAAAAPT